jgi:hypothetical protein
MVSMRLGGLLETLPLEQRAQRYREFAQEALRRASRTGDPDMRAGFLSMAAGWHALAEEIERTLVRTTPKAEEAGQASAGGNPH